MTNPYEPPREESSGPTRPERPHRAIWPFGCGAVLAVAMWLLSPVVAGKVEPWDNNLYYPIALFAAGFVAAWTGPKKFWAAPIGVYAGQVVVVIVSIPFTKTASLWPLGLAIAAVYTGIISGSGAALTATTYWSATQLFKRRT